METAINLPYYLKLSRSEQKASLEAIIFTAEEAVTVKYLNKLLLSDDLFRQDFGSDSEGPDDNGDEAQISMNTVIREKYNIKENYFQELIDEINSELLDSCRPYQIIKVGGGYQFATRPEYGQLLNKVYKIRSKRKLSQAALETLAIIAYRQPVTKPEVDQIRGVNSGDVISSLAEKNLVKIVGRKDALGKPLLYGTTQEFLQVFGLNSLQDLPKLRELGEESETVFDFENNPQEFLIRAVNDNEKIARNSDIDENALPGNIVELSQGKNDMYEDEELEEEFDEMDEGIDEFDDEFSDELEDEFYEDFEEMPEEYDVIDENFDEPEEDEEDK